MVWVTCTANHSPTATKTVSQKGVSRISQEFFQCDKISDTKNSEIIVYATMNLSRPGEIILQNNVQCGTQEVVSKRPNQILSLLDGRLCMISTYYLKNTILL